MEPGTLSEYWASLFLGGHLLFNFAPCADLQPPADPAKGFRRRDGGLGAAHRTLGRFCQAIGRNCALGLLEYFSRYYGFGFWLRLSLHTAPSAIFTMADVPPGNKLSIIAPVLRGFRDLDNGGDVQRRVAARALLAARYARIFPPQVDLGRNGMGANRAVRQSLSGLIFGELFHSFVPSIQTDAKTLATVVPTS